MKIWKDTCPAKEEKLFPALSMLPLVTLHVPFHIITYMLLHFYSLDNLSQSRFTSPAPVYYFI